MSVAHSRTLIAQAAAAPASKTYTVKPGDTLWSIAGAWLGDPFLWPEIYRLNGDVIQDPHWIRPGEVLKLPARAADAVATQLGASPRESVLEAARGAAPIGAPLVAARPTPLPDSGSSTITPPANTIRVGEYAAAPWVDDPNDPRQSGHIVTTRALSEFGEASKRLINVYDSVTIAPPQGTMPAVHSLFLTYTNGPRVEELGRIIVPTGVVEVTREPRAGEPVAGRVVKLFGEMLDGQRLVPYDTSEAIVTGRPASISDGRTATVRWISGESVLPGLHSYIVVDLARRDGVAPGDQIELFPPRRRSDTSHPAAIPDVAIARAQVLRVTPWGTTAIVTSQDQPRIERGTAARLAAKLP